MIHWIFAGLVLGAIVTGLFQNYIDARHERLRKEAYAKGDYSLSYYATRAFGAVAGGLIIGAALVGFVWLILAIGGKECREIEAQTGHNTEFYAIGGCFVEIGDGRSIPVDERSLGLLVDQLSDR